MAAMQGLRHGDEFVVPFDDKRATRRILLTKDVLDSESLPPHDIHSLSPSSVRLGALIGSPLVHPNRKPFPRISPIHPSNRHGNRTDLQAGDIFFIAYSHAGREYGRAPGRGTLPTRSAY